MSKLVLDEGVPEPLAPYLSGHSVRSVRELGFRGLNNGKLLDAIEAATFDVFITNDKRMDAEQQLQRRSFGVLILSTNSWPVIKRHTEEIAWALASAEPGTVSKVECGPLRSTEAAEGRSAGALSVRRHGRYGAV